MNACSDFEEDWLELLAGTAPAETRDRFDTHRATCDACATAHRAEAEVLGAFRGREDPAPPDLSDAVLAELDDLRPPTARPARLPVALLALAAALLLAWFLWPHRGSTPADADGRARAFLAERWEVAVRDAEDLVTSFAPHLRNVRDPELLVRLHTELAVDLVRFDQTPEAVEVLRDLDARLERSRGLDTSWLTVVDRLRERGHLVAALSVLEAAAEADVDGAAETYGRTMLDLDSESVRALSSLGYLGQ